MFKFSYFLFHVIIWRTVFFYKLLNDLKTTFADLVFINIFSQYWYYLEELVHL